MKAILGSEWSSGALWKIRVKGAYYGGSG